MDTSRSLRSVIHLPMKILRPKYDYLVIRMATEDITFQDYLIPKGSVISANVWCVCSFSVSMLSQTDLFLLHRRHMFTDDSVYKDPDAFKPERFIARERDGYEPEQDPRVAVFGFGRRCVSLGPFVGID